MHVAPGIVMSFARSLTLLVWVALPFARSAAADRPAVALAGSGNPAAWADEVTAPRNYIGAARHAVEHHHNVAAARHLRNAARMVAQHEGYATGRERARLGLAAEALRLTAKDVEAGAVSSAGQLDAVLNDTHDDLLARHPLYQ